MCRSFLWIMSITHGKHNHFLPSASQIAWPGTVSLSEKCSPALRRTPAKRCRLPDARCGGCAGQAQVAESLHTHSPPRPHACSEPCLGDTSATCIHAVMLLFDCLQTPPPSGISGLLILNGKRACQRKHGWPCS